MGGSECPTTRVVARDGSALVEHRARQGLTGYEQRAGACRQFSAQARDVGTNDRCDVSARQNFRCHWPVVAERRENEYSLFG